MDGASARAPLSPPAGSPAAHWPVDAPLEYQLVGVIAHCGPSLAIGHYVAFVRSGGGRALEQSNGAAARGAAEDMGAAAGGAGGQAGGARPLDPAAGSLAGAAEWLCADDEDVCALSEAQLLRTFSEAPGASGAVPYLLLYART
ncbi:hypothetical protein T492DRAFT_1051678 [Pavlovales sp. CCMP2436]|nr:hypothetical protein T492DRAFT_1051678 [Pavlovales sp. CCMP2436]